MCVPHDREAQRRDLGDAMKTLALLSLGLIASRAYAQTAPITIGPTEPCVSGFCYNVPNSAGVVIDMSPPHHYGQAAQLYVSINGDAYIGALPLNDSVYSGIILTDASGNQITVSATWNGRLKCSSGRAGGCQVVWSLVSGTLVTP